MTAVLVTRPSSEASALVSALRAAGLRVHAVPTIELAPIPASSTPGRRLRQTFLELHPADWIVVTSQFGARLAARQFLLADGLFYAPVRWAALGSAAARSLAAVGIQPDVTALVAQPGVAVERMAAGGRLAGRRVVVARSDVADASLPQLLQAAGAEVEAVATYRTIEGPSRARSALHQAVSDPALQAIVVASGSAARGLIQMVDGDSFWPPPRTDAIVERVRALPTVTVGPATTAAACGAGLHVAAEADEPTVKGIVRAVARALALDRAAPSESGESDR
jgi:uroporphyrinogen-III synthase